MQVVIRTVMTCVLLIGLTSCLFEKEALPTIKWGESPETIAAREKSIIGTLILQTDSQLSFETKLFKTRTSVRYYFDNNKLTHSEYLLLSRIRRGEYLELREIMLKDISKLFGNPIENSKISNEDYVKRFFDSEHEAFQAGYVNYVTIWENQTSVVKMLLRGGQKHATLRIQFQDKAKFPLIKTEQQKTETTTDSATDSATKETSTTKE